MVDCGKSVQIRSFFWPVFSCIRTEYGDLRCKSSGRIHVVAFSMTNSHMEVFYEKDIQKNYAQLTGKQLCQKSGKLKVCNFI